MLTSGECKECTVDFLRAVARGVLMILVVYCDLISLAARKMSRLHKVSRF